MSSGETLELVMNFTNAQRATSEVQKKLDAVENAKRPNQKNLAKLRKELESLKLTENEAFQTMQAALSKLEMSSNTSDAYRPFEQPIMSLDIDAEGDELSLTAEDTRTAAPTGNVQVIPVMSANRQVAINPPEKYKHGDDFTLWSARFKRYVKMAGIQDEQSLWTLLNQVDDRTAEKLDPVCESLSITQRRNPDLYLPILEKSIYPVTQSKTLRVQLTQMKQAETETVDDFAVRIRKIRNKIWHSAMPGGPGDELCYSVFLAGLKENEIRKDVMKSRGVNQFEQAVKAAVETENILLSSQHRDNTPDDTEPLGILQVDQTAGNNRSNAHDRSRQRDSDIRRQDYNHNGRDNHRPRNNPNTARYQVYGNQTAGERRFANQRPDLGPRRPGNENRYRNKECYNCGRLGHIARTCRDRLNSPRAGPSTGPYQPRHQ